MNNEEGAGGRAECLSSQLLPEIRGHTVRWKQRGEELAPPLLQALPLEKGADSYQTHSP